MVAISPAAVDRRAVGLALPDRKSVLCAPAFAGAERRLLLDSLHDRTEPVGLEDFEASLADDEAALIYQVAPDRDVFGKPAGGSWLMIVTRDGTRLHRLASGPEIDSAVAMVLGSIHSGADFEERASTLRRLLLPPQPDMPDGIDRWIVIPDGSLHLLPFNVLAPEQSLSMLPSATVWKHLTRRSSSSEAALIFADPETASLDLDDRSSPIDPTPHERRNRRRRREGKPQCPAKNRCAARSMGPHRRPR